MKNVILMALNKAARLNDEELGEEIRQFESGERKLNLRDERGRPFPLHPIILEVFKRVLEERRRGAGHKSDRKDSE